MIEAINIEEINIRCLPHSTQLLAKAIGLVATIRLLTERGGRPIRIPITLTRGNILQDLLSNEELKNLITLWGGDIIELPKPDKILQQYRNHLMIKDVLNDGMSHAQAAVKYNLTRRHVINIVSAHQTEKNQYELF